MLQKNDLAILEVPRPDRRRRRLGASWPELRTMPLDNMYELAERLEGEPVPGATMSEAEFVEWCPDELRAEWVDGRVILMSPSNVEHDDLSVWLIRFLGDYVEAHDIGAVYQNIFVRFAGQRRRRVPDLLFISKESLARLQPTYLDGPPDLIIEIISPDSQSRDRRDKYLDYEKAGVREYWIVDPLSKTVETYRLDRKKFHRIEEIGGIISSIVLKGLCIKTAQLWQKPLPKVSAVLKWMSRK